MNIIVIPDSFKGTLSSLEVGKIISERILFHHPDYHVTAYEVADGGEGTADVFLHNLPSEKVSITVPGPYGEPVNACYCLTEDGTTAVIESASCIGLPLVKDNPDPSATSTYGLGLMIRDAMDKGAQRIILGLGGSSTNDGGCGIASALGVRFLDKEGRCFIPVGGNLKDINIIDISEKADIDLICMCDVTNPFYGPAGAAYIYAPQKGADEKMVKLLDEGLRHLADRLLEFTGNDIAIIPGAGAAGGIAGGLKALFGCQLKPGIETVLDLISFDSLLEECDLVITGEGKFDHQSLQGKVVDGILKRCRRKSVPLTVIAGTSEIESVAGISHIYSTLANGRTMPADRHQAIDNLARTCDEIFSEDF